MALIFKSAERSWIAADVTRQQQHAGGGMFCSRNACLLPQLLFIEWEPVIFLRCLWMAGFLPWHNSTPFFIGPPSPAPLIWIFSVLSCFNWSQLHSLGTFCWKLILGPNLVSVRQSKPEWIMANVITDPLVSNTPTMYLTKAFNYLRSVVVVGLRVRQTKWMRF